MEETLHRVRPVIVNSALNHMSATQMQHDALWASLREPRLPENEKAAPPSRRRFAFLHRLRPAFG